MTERHGRLTLEKPAPNKYENEAEQRKRRYIGTKRYTILLKHYWTDFNIRYNNFLKTYLSIFSTNV